MSNPIGEISARLIMHRKFLLSMYISDKFDYIRKRSFLVLLKSYLTGESCLWMIKEETDMNNLGIVYPPNKHSVSGIIRF